MHTLGLATDLVETTYNLQHTELGMLLICTPKRSRDAASFTEHQRDLVDWL